MLGSAGQNRSAVWRRGGIRWRTPSKMKDLILKIFGAEKYSGNHVFRFIASIWSAFKTIISRVLLRVCSECNWLAAKPRLSEPSQENQYVNQQKYWTKERLNRVKHCYKILGEERWFWTVERTTCLELTELLFLRLTLHYFLDTTSVWCLRNRF